MALESLLYKTTPVMELSTALIWILRIVLPIILFCIYFKLQAPKEDQYSGGTENAHSRAKLLALRQATIGAPAPPSMEDISLKDQVEAAALFSGGVRGGKGGRRVTDESRGVAGRTRWQDKHDKVQNTQPEHSRSAEVGEEEPQSSAQLQRPSFSPSKDKMHLESLLNYVAFGGNNQQRVFLPEENGAPPPPPPPPPAKKPNDEGGGETVSSTVTRAAADTANTEAQMVLSGALGIARSDVAKYLYEQMMEAHVEVSESTFVLLIDVCLAGTDLKGASDFLMKMETAGLLPNSDLLDKVMDLYSQQKNEKKPAPHAGANSLRAVAKLCEALGPACDEGARTKLSSSAAVFIPSFIPPPPPPRAQLHSEPTEELDKDVVNSDLHRTKLTAESKPFEPKLINATLGPDMLLGPGHWEVFPGKKRLPGSLPREAPNKNWSLDQGGHWSLDRSTDANLSEAKWSSDRIGATWSSDANWDYDVEAPIKKAWVAKQPPASQNEHSQSNDSSSRGAKTAVKVWRPKAETAESGATK